MSHDFFISSLDDRIFFLTISSSYLRLTAYKLDKLLNGPVNKRGTIIMRDLIRCAISCKPIEEAYCRCFCVNFLNWIQFNIASKTIDDNENGGIAGLIRDEAFDVIDGDTLIWAIRAGSRWLRVDSSFDMLGNEQQTCERVLFYLTSLVD